jgi:hypothetical protein
MTSSNCGQNNERFYEKIGIAVSPELPVKVSAILLAILFFEKYRRQR